MLQIGVTREMKYSGAWVRQVTKSHLSYASPELDRARQSPLVARWRAGIEGLNHWPLR
jgi:hypothetical protein